MRTIRGVLVLIPLALLAGSTTGCWGTNCGPFANPTLAPGETYQGVDPRAALAALLPQTMTLFWVRTSETTTVTVTTTATGAPTEVHHDCGGDPQEFEVAATLAVQTGDGRLDDTFTGTLSVDPSGVLRTPANAVGTAPASILVGTGVVADTFLDPAQNSVALSLQVVASGAGAAYGPGSVYLYGRDNINLATVTPAP